MEYGYDLAEKQIDEIVESNLCLKVSDLAVKGEDISNLGFKGRDIGETLNALLSMVIQEEIENNKGVLLDTATKLKNN